jgi:hypothetical protein
MTRSSMEQVRSRLRNCTASGAGVLHGARQEFNSLTLISGKK